MMFCTSFDSPYRERFSSESNRLHKLVLDHLGVAAIAVVIGGSMGGMAVLEWPLCTPPGFVKRIIPIATSARHSAWCISWGEAQRQSIYSDPAYEDGYYTPGKEPSAGLAAARMAALLTYRTRDSFESRFGRKPQKPAVSSSPSSNNVNSSSEMITPPHSPIMTQLVTEFTGETFARSHAIPTVHDRSQAQY